MIYLAKEAASLLETLATFFPESSKSTLRSWLKEGRISVDDEVIKAGNVPISPGQRIQLGEKQQFIKGKLKVLYEDQHIVVVDKPEGLLSVSTAFEKGETVHGYLKEKFRPKRVHVVHRLDQETSGVMMFALSEKARDQLKNTFEKHDIERTYQAIVEGGVQPKKGTWQSYLWEDANYYVHSTEDSENGQLAITHYCVLGTSKRYDWLELKLETGRKNQIRVHCQKIGHPIAGDKKYGAATSPAKRLCLHACTLAFDHPITGKKMFFSSPLPETMQRMIEQMGDKIA